MMAAIVGFEEKTLTIGCVLKSHSICPILKGENTVPHLGARQGSEEDSKNSSGVPARLELQSTPGGNDE
ncbi:hypothetical protein [Bradyrhizobium sp. STM 3562]|uniref:hypothetical protein n=1 Tax=Bradyrhizobium sp. STM 3562 TaxID=578924 RepID=UPI00388D7BCD